MHFSTPSSSYTLAPSAKGLLHVQPQKYRNDPFEPIVEITPDYDLNLIKPGLTV